MQSLNPALNKNPLDAFLIEFDQVIEKINSIDTKSYASTRNYLNGAVSRLSPFITHGVISTKLITQTLLKRELESLPLEDAYRRIEPFIFQQAWRDYFHRLWEFHQSAIFSSLNHSQKSVISNEVPSAILNAKTNINAIDEQLACLYQTGYIHNHARLWIAAFVANMLGTGWQNAANWFHYHLLDGDLASNALSWQWVAGTLNKNKKIYIANQDNINKFSRSSQSDTLLDNSYEHLHANMPIISDTTKNIDFSKRERWQPKDLESIPKFVKQTPLKELELNPNKPIFLRNLYQLDHS